MIFYVCAYTMNAEIAAKRQYVLSQAAINRAGVIIREMKKSDNVTVICTALSRASMNIPEEVETISDDVTIYHPSLKARSNRMNIIIQCCKCIKKMAKKGDTVVINNANHITMPVALYAKKILKLSVIYQLEELYSGEDYYKGAPRYLMLMCERLVKKNSDGIITVGEHLIEKKNANVPFVVSFGYSTEEHIECNVSDKTNEILHVLYSGRLDEEGGIMLFLDSLALIDKPVRVDITGGGPLQENVRNYINKNALVECVYHGFVSKEKLDQLMVKADVAISCLQMRSPFSQVSFPSKVYQYLAYGGVVVSSDVPAVRPLETAFKNLQVYRDDSANSIAEIINRQSPIDKIQRLGNIDTFKVYNQFQQQMLCSFFEKITSKNK